MIKSALVAAAAVAFSAPAALAGPYVNAEINAGYTGNDFNGSVTDLHIGYEGGDGIYGFYIQGGPAIVSPEGGDTDMELSGKIGGSVQATDTFGVYGEISFITTDEEPVVGTKIGAKWNF